NTTSSSPPSSRPSTGDATLIPWWSKPDWTAIHHRRRLGGSSPTGGTPARAHRADHAASYGPLAADRGGDIDLTAMPECAVHTCHRAWGALTGSPTAVIHGGLAAHDLRIDHDRVGSSTGTRHVSTTPSSTWSTCQAMTSPPSPDSWHKRSRRRGQRPIGPRNPITLGNAPPNYQLHTDTDTGC